MINILMIEHFLTIYLSIPLVIITISPYIIPDERRRSIIDNRFFVSSCAEWHPLLIRKVGSCLFAISKLLEWRFCGFLSSAIKTSRKPKHSKIIEKNWPKIHGKTIGLKNTCSLLP